MSLILDPPTSTGCNGSLPLLQICCAQAEGQYYASPVQWCALESESVHTATECALSKIEEYKDSILFCQSPKASNANSKPKPLTSTQFILWSLLLSLLFAGAAASAEIGNETSSMTNKMATGPCASREWTSREVEQLNSGTWWTPWKMVVNCLFVSLGDGGSKSYSYAHTTDWSISGALGLSFGDIKSVLPSPTLGVTYGESNTVTDSDSCVVPPGAEVGCVWTQQEMLWMDIRTRKIKHINTCDGGEDWPEDWEYARVDVPVVAQNGIPGGHGGCSTTRQNCNNCNM